MTQRVGDNLLLFFAVQIELGWAFFVKLKPVFKFLDPPLYSVVFCG